MNHYAVKTPQGAQYIEERLKYLAAHEKIELLALNWDWDESDEQN